ncbi:MAG: hypothetical protein ACYDC7_06825 [Acidithiobacillus ferrivorans]|jgi:hypothetical protein
MNRLKQQGNKISKIQFVKDMWHWGALRVPGKKQFKLMRMMLMHV